jgi:hypothetical protein
MSTVISVEHLSKTYRLGQIGTGTFSHDLNVWWAKMRGKPNPCSALARLLSTKSILVSEELRNEIS